MTDNNQDSNRRYTVYEIEKLTQGKLTKYKLTKAILANELKAQKVKQKKRGRGIPNYFIQENDLNTYLKKLEDNKKHFIQVPEDKIFNSSTEKEAELSDLLRDSLTKFDKMEEKLFQLEEKNAVIIPLLEKQNSFIEKETKRSDERREMIQKLISMPSFMVKKRQEVLEELNKLS